MTNTIISRIEESPIIAALKRDTDVEAIIESQVTTVFLLHADIFNIGNLVEKFQKHDKKVLIHLDFLEGLGRDNKAIEYICRIICPDGIISTKTNHIKYAKELGMFTIQRFFLIDNLSYETTIRTVQSVQPDMIEIMPAVMPSVIRRICKSITLPVIAGGLIDSKEDIIEILKAGAIGASTGKKALWYL